MRHTVSVTVCFSASDIFEMQRISEAYSTPRAALIRCVMKRFMGLCDGEIRRWMIEEELVERKGKLLEERRKIDGKIQRVDKDLGGPRKGSGAGAKQGAVPRSG